MLGALEEINVTPMTVHMIMQNGVSKGYCRNLPHVQGRDNQVVHYCYDLHVPWPKTISTECHYEMYWTWVWQDKLTEVIPYRTQLHKLMQWKWVWNVEVNHSIDRDFWRYLVAPAWWSKLLVMKQDETCTGETEEWQQKYGKPKDIENTALCSLIFTAAHLMCIEINTNVQSILDVFIVGEDGGSTGLWHKCLTLECEV